MYSIIGASVDGAHTVASNIATYEKALELFWARVNSDTSGDYWYTLFGPRCHELLRWSPVREAAASLLA